MQAAAVTYKLIPTRQVLRDWPAVQPGAAPGVPSPAEAHGQGGATPLTLTAVVQRAACSAGDSAAYARQAPSLDDVVIVSSLRTATTKVCTLPACYPAARVLQELVASLWQCSSLCARAAVPLC